MTTEKVIEVYCTTKKKFVELVNKFPMMTWRTIPGGFETHVIGKLPIDMANEVEKFVEKYNKDNYR